MCKNPHMHIKERCWNSFLTEDQFLTHNQDLKKNPAAAARFQKDIFNEIQSGPPI